MGKSKSHEKEAQKSKLCKIAYRPKNETTTTIQELLIDARLATLNLSNEGKVFGVAFAFKLLGE